MIAIIDYDAGNIKSVEKAVKRYEEDVCITRDVDVLRSADKVILPGVGAFGDAMEKLQSYGLISVMKEIVDKGTPLLGICLGLQLLFEESEESPGVEGLGILKGKIIRIPEAVDLKVPHIGWNSLKFEKESPILEGLSDGAYVYFVHSFYLKAEEDIVIASTEYGTHIHAAVQKGNVYACQFHPEKSSDVGLRILENFVTM